MRRSSGSPTAAMESKRKTLMADSPSWGDPVGPRPSQTQTRTSPSVLRRSRDLDNLQSHWSTLSSSPWPENEVELEVSESEIFTVDMTPPAICTSYISLEGWTFESILKYGRNFSLVKRIAATDEGLHTAIEDYERTGVPMIIEGCDKHPKWQSSMFDVEWYRQHCPKGAAYDFISYTCIHTAYSKQISVFETCTTGQTSTSRFQTSSLDLVKHVYLRFMVVCCSRSQPPKADG